MTGAGQVVPYTFTVTNTGNLTLTNVTVSDPNCDAASSGPTGDTNNDSKLQTSETWVYTLRHTVTQAEIDAGGNLSNTVTVDSAESAPDTDTVDIPITQSPALLLTKTAKESSYSAVGDVLHYSYVVKNTGNVRLAGPVTVTDDKTTVTCPALSTIGNQDGFLDPGESVTCTATYTVQQSDIDAGNVTNIASALAGGTTSNGQTVNVPFVKLASSTATSIHDAQHQVRDHGRGGCGRPRFRGGHGRCRSAVAERQRDDRLVHERELLGIARADVRQRRTRRQCAGGRRNHSHKARSPRAATAFKAHYLAT